MKYYGDNNNIPNGDDIKTTNSNVISTDASVVTTETPIWRKEAKLLVDLAIPTVVLQLGAVFPNFLIASYVGRGFGSLYLDGFTLASLMGNLFNLSLLQGLYTSADTLSPQAYGAGNYKEVGLLAIRGYILSIFLVIIPINVVLILRFQDILIRVGEDPDAAGVAHRWYRIYAIGLPFYALYMATWKFLSAQEIMKPLIYVCIITCGIVFPIVLELGTQWFGYLGSAMANVIYQMSQASLLLAYLVWKKPHTPGTWPGLLWREALEWVAIRRYIYLGIGGMLAASEWIYWEILTMLIGTLGLIPLSIHAVPTQMLTIGFMFPFGIGIALAVRLGIILPQSVTRAKQLTVGCCLASAVLFGGIAILLFIFRKSLYSIFTTEEAVIEGCERIWWKVCVYYFNIAIYGVNMGIATGLGRQWMFGIITIAFLWALSLPAVYFLAIRGGGGLEMAWACIYQPFIAMNICFFYAFWKEDWDKIRTEIRIREGMDSSSPSDDALKHNNLSWLFLGFLQGLFSIMLLVLFFISISSPWFVRNYFARGWVLYVNGVKDIIFLYGIRTLCYEQGGLVTQSNGWMLPPFILHVFHFFAYAQDYLFDTNNNTQWIWIPLTVPVCMLSFSLCVVVLKWAVVGKYREGIVPIPSMLYLRWWIVDRAIALWEFWVGRYILKTPWINLFYFLMGAKIHRTVSIESFIREFDLIEILQDSSLEFQIHCRKFSKWGKNENPSICFRHIFIGRSCTVKGMVSAGASIGDNVIVEKLSVVQPGSEVPQGTHVNGNPAFTSRESSYGAVKRTRSYSLGHLGFLKLTWLVVELYIFYGTMLLGYYLWISHLPKDHRYANLFKWPLLIFWLGFFSIFTSVLLKWALIGKRRPGSVINDTLWRVFADWAADWHFEVGVGFFYSLTTNFHFWNIVLKMHGMDIDMSSKIGGPPIFLPSKVDLITIKNSLVSPAVTFSLKNNGHYHGINIVNSSIGYFVHVNPDNNKTDLTISGSTVPPMALVTSNIIPDKPDPKTLQSTTFEIIWQGIVATLVYIKAFVLLLGTMIPSYEFGIYVFEKTVSIWIRVPALVGALILQNLFWTLLFSCFQYGILINSKDTGRPFSSILYMVYIDVAYTYQNYSFLYTFLGSPIFNVILKYFLGVKFEGRALLYPQQLYEFPYITIADRTIVDGAHVTGHYAVYNDVKVGPCKISGVLHEGCYVVNTVIDSEESESWRTFMGTFEIPKQGNLY